jgi:diphthine-ammonia ligase
MKVVGLVSGGKDSCYNLLLAKRDGHEIVWLVFSNHSDFMSIFSLANLYPPNNNELDSYMYQSVGAEGIKALAAAMQLPLYRKEITGTPKNIGSEYRYEPGDEVEDLFYLLSSIKMQNPEIEGCFY